MAQTELLIGVMNYTQEFIHEAVVEEVQALARGLQGVRSQPPSSANYVKIMQCFTRNGVYTPNFGLKIRIFLIFTPPL